MELPDDGSGESDLEQDQKVDMGDVVLEDYVKIASISLHAMVGIPNPRTMRVVGKLQRKRVVILVNTGNTYNFVDT